MGEEEPGTLLERVAQALRGHGLMVSVQGEPEGTARRRPAAHLRLRKDGHQLDYSAALQRWLAPSSLGAVLTQLRHSVDLGEPPPLLVTDYVSTSLADQLREQQQQFADTAGNAYLEAGGFFVFVSGRKLHAKQRALRASSGFSATRLKVLFALICDPDLAAAPYRAIAAAAGIALGAMPAVIADLQQHGALIVSEQRRRLNSSKRLLDEWAQAYALGLRGKTLAGRYLTPQFDAWRQWQLNPAHTRWGGEAAATLLVGEHSPHELTPGVLTLYGDKLPARLIDQQQLEAATPAAYEHLVELRKPFWGQSLDADEPAATVPPALIYADLLAAGSAHCLEMAELIYNAHLVARFPPGAALAASTDWCL